MRIIQELSFEQAFAELEEVINKLESGELTLDESMDLFERGRGLSEHCQTLLNSAELRIQQMNDKGEANPL